MKKEITILCQILSGNLGEGWEDNNEAADDLASFTAETWADDLRGYVDDGYDLDIRIDVQHNTEGCSAELSVIVTDEGGNYDTATEDDVRSVMTDRFDIWQRFCDE